MKALLLLILLLMRRGYSEGDESTVAVDIIIDEEGIFRGR